MSPIDLSFIIKQIDFAASNRQLEEVDRLIKSLDIVEQMELHGQLNMESLAVIKDHKDLIHINKSVMEHMVWYYFSKQKLSDSILLEVMKIYEEEGFIALESTIVSALKDHKVNEHQIEIIQSRMNTKEVIKQIGKWMERNVKNNQSR